MQAVMKEVNKNFVQTSKIKGLMSHELKGSYTKGALHVGVWKQDDGPTIINII